VPYSSPFEPALARRGAVLGALGEVRVALRFGDPEAEYRALTGEAALVDLSWRGVLEMTGRDRVRFLHGMCTNDIKRLQPGQGCMAAIVNRQGKMVAEMIVHAAENALLLQMDRSNLEAAREALGRFVVADDVAMKVSDAAVLGVRGPRARAVLALPELPDFHGVVRAGVLVARNRTAAADGYDLVVPAARPEEADRLLDHGLLPAGFEASERLRVACGFPRWGADMGTDFLPMEAGLEPIAISYTKGCYIGQEVIQRVKTYSEPPKTLVQLEVSGASPGDPILAGGQEIGHVTSAAPELALGYVRKEFKAPGTEVAAAGKRALVRALPWQARLNVAAL
jgi:folate-binding protein YgfZ